MRKIAYRKGGLKMKSSKILISLLVIVGIVFLSACSSKVTRDSLKVDKALIGHWVNANGSPDYYFSETRLTKVEKDGTKTEMTYVVLKSNDNENTITIRVSNPAGTVVDEDIRDMKYSTDKKTLTETVSILGIKYSEDNYNYVDNKTNP
jgi:ABC-type glycerol-3-phosphate transport system substrate-binding protein